MVEPRPSQRRLAAILAADVAGYSRQVALDEAGALAALRRLRAEVLEPTLAAHGGRLFKSMGDGFLAEFISTVDALRCALAIQVRLEEGAPEAPRLRIGLHVGDVVVEGDDLLGDGVNVAARIEGLAEPGGIALSARVREDAAGRVSLGALEDLGERELKNIPAPVRVYRLRPGAAPAVPAAGPKLAALDRPALAVLPFANMSGDPEQEYFADGITEELITQLSRARWFYVIARNSTFTYKGRAVDIRQVGRELGVRYVLEGSVRKGGGRVRITGQLIDAETGHHVWADRFDGTLDDIFELQDRVAEAVAGAVEPSVQHAEMRRANAKPTESLTAYDLYLRALSLPFRTDRVANAAALALFRQALAADPGFVLAEAYACWAHAFRKSQSWQSPEDAAEGAHWAREILDSETDDPTALCLAGHARAVLAGDHAVAVGAVERALALNPGSGLVLRAAGLVYALSGIADRAIECLRRGLRLSPVDPENGYSVFGMAMAHMVAGNHEEMLTWAQRSVREAPRWASSHRLLVAAYWMLGRQQEARTALKVLLETMPNLRLADAVTPYRPGPARDAYEAALRGAGHPE